MEAVFDHTAKDYDTSFTRSITGSLQRKSVWRYLDTILPEGESLNILELNCGTGEDALHLAALGHKVTATDLSGEMINVANAKKQKHTSGKNVTFRVMPIESLQSVMQGQQFDLVLSNFGGLNCLPGNDLQLLFSELAPLLAPGGCFIGVIMPKFCFQETLYFLAKGKIRKAFRRNTNNSVPANLDGKIQPTWYYNPGMIKEFLPRSLQVRAVVPVGFFLPPSYFEPLVSNKKGLMKLLDNLEAAVAGSSIAARWSDHFLIDIRKSL